MQRYKTAFTQTNYFPSPSSPYLPPVLPEFQRQMLAGTPIISGFYSMKRITPMESPYKSPKLVCVCVGSTCLLVPVTSLCFGIEVPIPSMRVVCVCVFTIHPMNFECKRVTSVFLGNAVTPLAHVRDICWPEGWACAYILARKWVRLVTFACFSYLLRWRRTQRVITGRRPSELWVKANDPAWSLAEDFRLSPPGLDLCANLTGNVHCTLI